MGKPDIDTTQGRADDKQGPNQLAAAQQSNAISEALRKRLLGGREAATAGASVNSGKPDTVTRKTDLAIAKR